MSDICTVGRVERHEELPDGRYNLVLRGLSRVKLDELSPDERLYRRARAELLDGKRGNERVAREAMTTLMSTASLVGAVVRRTHPDFSLGVQPDDPPHHVTDTLADRLLADADARQDLTRDPRRARAREEADGLRRRPARPNGVRDLQRPRPVRRSTSRRHAVARAPARRATYLDQVPNTASHGVRSHGASALSLRVPSTARSVLPVA